MPVPKIGDAVLAAAGDAAAEAGDLVGSMLACAAEGADAAEAEASRQIQAALDRKRGILNPRWKMKRRKENDAWQNRNGIRSS